MQYCFKKLCYICNFLLYSKHLMPLASGHEMNLGHMWQISVQTIPCHPPHLSSMSPPPSEPKAGLNGVPSSPWAKLDQDQGLPLLSQWNPSSGLTIFLLLHIHWSLTISGENNPMRVRSTKIPWPPAFPEPSAPLNPFPHPWSTISHSPKQRFSTLNSVFKPCLQSTPLFLTPRQLVYSSLGAQWF